MWYIINTDTHEGLGYVVSRHIRRDTAERAMVHLQADAERRAGPGAFVPALLAQRARGERLARVGETVWHDEVCRAALGNQCWCSDCVRAR